MQNEKKTIAIGYDDAAMLAPIITNLKNGFSEPHTVVSAARASDLLSIVRSIGADLIILCFRNNLQALQNLAAFSQKTQIPTLCLIDRFESETAYCIKNSIVFSYPYDHIKQKENFCARVNSIFLLRNAGTQEHNSFVNPASLMHQTVTNRDLSRYVLELDQKMEILMRIKERITDLFPRVEDTLRSELTSIVNAIKTSVTDKKLWEDFKLYFEEIDPGFLAQLAGRHPGLSSKDLKYCCYLKMNMDNDDIRSLLGINQESVRTHKYRLKKKLSLSKDQDLTSYIKSVGMPVAFTA
ncbi:MAG TPA: hypothetical protein VD905_09020 [Flavobacteriales bacterium]|nr:hypothetical protein [Flavobacteriales bacterium]